MPCIPDHDTVGIASYLTFVSQRLRQRWIVCHSSGVKFVESTCLKISLQRHKLSSSLPSPTQVYLAWSVAILILHATFLEFQSFLNIGTVCPWEQQNVLDFRTIKTYCMQYEAVIFAQMRYTCSWFTVMFTPSAIFFFEMYLIFFQPSSL